MDLLGAMRKAVAGRLASFKRSQLKHDGVGTCSRCGAEAEGGELSVNQEPGGRKAICKAFLDAAGLEPPTQVGSAACLFLLYRNMCAAPARWLGGYTSQNCRGAGGQERVCGLQSAFPECFVTSCNALLQPAHCTLPCMQFASTKVHAKLFRKEDATFAAAWRAYHEDHARLRLLCQQCVAAVNIERQQEGQAGVAAAAAGAAGEP